MPNGAFQLTQGQYGPAFSGGRHRRPGRPDWRRLSLLFVSFVMTGAVLAAGTAVALVWYGESRLNRQDVEGTTVPGDIDGDGSVDIHELADVRNVLVVGSDSRDDLGRRDRRRLGTGNFEGVRTDTLMLVQLDPERDAAAMLSFPRDLLVTRCDGTQGRINGAYQVGIDTEFGGPGCVVRTINELTGIPINHYVEVDFRGFVDFVDALGGVRLYLEEPIVDDDAHIDLPSGCVTLDGRDALGFVRVRKIDNDFGRIARQQRFVREIVEQVTSARIALDIPRLFSLVDAAARSVDVDSSLSIGVMRQLAFSFRDLSSDRIDARAVPAFNRVINGTSYVVADDETAAPLFAAFREGVAAPADLGTEAPGDVRISDVPPLRVLNGTAVGGLAAAAGDLLTTSGFTVAGTDNADQSNARTTVVYHPERRREEALLVAKALGGAAVRRNVDLEELTVVMGADLSLDALAALAEEVADHPTAAPKPADAPTYAGASRDEERRNC